MTGRWSRLDQRVQSVAAEGVRFGLMTGRWVAQQPDAGGLRPVMLTWQHRGRHHVIERWLCPVKHDRTSGREKSFLDAYWK